jgi:hypothetical protein
VFFDFIVSVVDFDSEPVFVVCRWKRDEVSTTSHANLLDVCCNGSCTANLLWIFGMLFSEMFSVHMRAVVKCIFF